MTDQCPASTVGSAAKWFWPAAVGVLMVHAILLAHSTYCHSPSYDEPAHLAAGISHWRFGDFRLYRVNPPLVRMVAALPVLALQPRIDWGKPPADGAARSEFAIGSQFFTRDAPRVLTIFRRAQWTCILFSVLGGLICAMWARALYGPPSGLLAVTLWCFSPLVLANAHLLTPDTGAAALGAAATFAFWHWLQYPTLSKTFLLGALLGLAELTKFTWIILPFVWGVVWLAWCVVQKSGFARTARQSGHVIVCAIVCLFMINTLYNYEGMFGRLDAFSFRSELFSGQPRPPSMSEAGNRFRDHWLGRLRIPLPEHYVLGIDQQRCDFERGWPSYLRGEWRNRGWYHYYVYGLAVKEPLGAWILLGLASGVSALCRGFSVCARHELVLLAPGLSVLAFVSSQTGFNHHLRYVLPALPFVFIWVSKVARVWSLNPASRYRPAIKGILIVGLGWLIAASIRQHPHSHSYFNELAGGPARGHWHLVDSNIDWGQDLLPLRHWLDRHPEVKLDGLAYTIPDSLMDVSAFGFAKRKPPISPIARERRDDNGGQQAGPMPGWYAVFVSQLRSSAGEYDYFLDIEPVARLGDTAYVYHITLDEANRVRRKKGLRELQ